MTCRDRVMTPSTTGRGHGSQHRRCDPSDPVVLNITGSPREGSRRETTYLARGLGIRPSEARQWARLAELYPTDAALVAAIDALSPAWPTIDLLLAYGRRPGPRPELEGAQQLPVGWAE